MTEFTNLGVPNELESLRAERDALAEQIEGLGAELAETNRGVVALYAELDDKAAQLRDASELKSRFLSYMSHEFRTPLGSIRSIARILSDQLDGSLTEEQQMQVTLVQNAAVELTEMVDDLLDLAKIEAGRINIAPKWFAMPHLFSALRGMFKPIIANKDVALIFAEPDENLPQLFTDDRKLSQILRNFISNALKFTPSGAITVRVHIDGNFVEFSVSDTGIGIAPDHLPRLFRDFAQIDTALQRRYRGTGLGLSLSKRFAELLGGWVSATSVEGEGSVFTVRIPIRLPGYEQSAMPPTSDPDLPLA